MRRKTVPKVFYKGDFSLLENGRRVAVVGFRKVSELVVRRVRKIVQNDINVVSNLVEGVDSIAHKTAIEFEGHTIGAIGTPLNKYVSAENKHLHEKSPANSGDYLNNGVRNYFTVQEKEQFLAGNQGTVSGALNVQYTGEEMKKRDDKSGQYFTG